ncbi:hypothetical protein ACGFSI_11585 [Streptomyces virginiae]|uniref:hypothetical protein n=1 Tax=Streptomyces virginiae TaxID=1961 RepID=UPI003720D21D
MSTCLTSGARPLGSLLAGGLGTWAGVRPALIVGTCLLVVPLVVLALSPLRALRHMPEPPAEPEDPSDSTGQPVANVPAPGPEPADALRDDSSTGGSA